MSVNVKLSSAIFLLFFSLSCFADTWAPRIREHYEISVLKVGSESFEYRGFTNTFNYWLEKPYAYSYGLALGPVFGSAESRDERSPLGEKIKLWKAGVVAKYFFAPQIVNIYARLGLSYLYLANQGAIGDGRWSRPLRWSWLRNSA